MIKIIENMKKLSVFYAMCVKKFQVTKKKRTLKKNNTITHGKHIMSCL